MRVFSLVLFILLSLVPRVLMADSMYGRENMAAFYAAQVRARADGTPVKIHIVGDSKVSGQGVTADYRLDSLLSQASNGYPVVITHDGYAGQNSIYWASTAAALVVANHSDADLLIVDFGTNERVTAETQTNAQTTANNLAALAIIRAAKSISSMSILFLGQTPANNYQPDLNQTTAIMQEINADLKQVAIQTNSAYYETLDLFQRAHSEAGWMEQISLPEPNSGNVHPGNPMNLVFAGELSKILFPLPFSASYVPTLVNSWAPWQNMSVFQPKVFRDGPVVSFDGLIQPGYTAAAATLFVLPPMYRPKANKFISVNSDPNGGSSTIVVMNTGEVMTGNAFTKIYVTLDQIKFRVD